MPVPLYLLNLLALRLTSAHSAVVRTDLVWDMQFSGPGVGPYTLFEGEGWSILQDGTRTDADTLPVTP